MLRKYQQRVQERSLDVHPAGLFILKHVQMVLGHSQVQHNNSVLMRVSLTGAALQWSGAIFMAAGYTTNSVTVYHMDLLQRLFSTDNVTVQQVNDIFVNENRNKNEN